MKKIYFVVIVIVLGLGGAIRYGYFVMHTGRDAADDVASSQQMILQEREIKKEEPLPEGMRMFRSEPFRFTLLIPQDLAMEEYAESGDARTFVFSHGERSFQIYITPYNKDHIDAERFALDHPGGMPREQQEIEIGGVKAVTFIGEQPPLGETREVWFIKDGLLYEVTTTRENDLWLSELMTRFHFI